MQTFYQILGVSENATDADIKIAWRKSAMKLHPDRNKDPKAEVKFKEMKMAYETLSDPSLRREYDTSLPSASDSSFSFSEDSSRQFFEQRGYGSDNGVPTDSLAISFWESILGCQKNVQMWLGTEFNVKRVSVFVTFAAGIGHGEIVRINTNQGNGLLQVYVLDDAVFTRQGLDIEVDFPVPICTLLQGGSVLLPHWQGDLNIQIPDHTCDGMRMRVIGKGVKAGEGYNQKTGDLYMVCRAIYPEKLSKLALEKIESLAKEFKKDDDKKTNEWIRAVKSNWARRN